MDTKVIKVACFKFEVLSTSVAMETILRPPEARYLLINFQPFSYRRSLGCVSLWIISEKASVKLELEFLSSHDEPEAIHDNEGTCIL